MNEAKWRSKAELPDAPNDWSISFPWLGVELADQSRAEKYLNYANVLSPALVSTPTSEGKYLPPVVISQNLRSKLLRNSKVMVLVNLAMVVIGSLLIYATTRDLEFMFTWLVVFGFLSGHACFSYQLCNNPEQITDRGLYYAWSIIHGSTAAKTFIAFMIIIGTTQYGMTMFSSHEDVLNDLGLHFQLFHDGEYWRIFSAPYLHTGVSHWLSNTIIGTGIVLIYWPCLRHLTTVAILLCGTGSLLGTYIYSEMIGIDVIGIVGISGGVAGIVGIFFATVLRFPEHFPEQMMITVLFVALLTFLAFSFVTSSVSFVAHTTGFSLGMAIGFLSNPISNSFMREFEVRR